MTVGTGGARRVTAAVLPVIAWAGAARPLHAEAPRATPAAIEVDRSAAPGGRAGLGFDDGEPVDAWGVSLALGWLERPIALGAGSFGAGTPASAPVRRRQTVALGGALAVGDSVVVDAVLRASHQVGDRLAAAGDPARLSRGVLHDLRLGGRIRLVGDRARAALLRAELTLPTGDDAALAGDAAWTLAWHLIGRATLPRQIGVAATAGIRLHGAEVVIGRRLVGDELLAAAGASVPLAALGLGDEPIALTAELTYALGDRLGDRKGPSPAEARLGVRLQALPALAITASAGVGLNDQIGAPRLRALIALAWTPPGPPPAPGPALPPEAEDEPDEP